MSDPTPSQYFKSKFPTIYDREDDDDTTEETMPQLYDPITPPILNPYTTTRPAPASHPNIIPLPSTLHTTPKTLTTNATPDIRYAQTTVTDHQGQLHTPKSAIPSTQELMQDNNPIGDHLQVPKPTDTCRFYWQNVNTFTMDPEGGDFKEACVHMQDIGTNHVGFTEHISDTNNYHVKSWYYDSMKHIFNNGELVLSSSPIPTAKVYKPGGTLSMVIGNSTS